MCAGYCILEPQLSHFVELCQVFNAATGLVYTLLLARDEYVALHSTIPAFAFIHSFCTRRILICKNYEVQESFTFVCQVDVSCEIEMGVLAR